jgi:hypothetical protein
LHADTTPKLTHADLKLKNFYSQFQLCGWRAKIVNEQFTLRKNLLMNTMSSFHLFDCQFYQLSFLTISIHGQLLWYNSLRNYTVVFFDHQCTRTTVMIFISLRNYTQVWKGCVLLCLWKLCDQWDW